MWQGVLFPATLQAATNLSFIEKSFGEVDGHVNGRSDHRVMPYIFGL